MRRLKRIKKQPVAPLHKDVLDKEAQAEELKKLKKKWRLALFISAIGILIILGAVFWPKPKSEISANPSTVGTNDRCLAANTYSCYKSELTDITKQQGPESATAVVKAAYNKSSYVKSQCHQLMHVVGRMALEKYGNISDTYAHGDQFCWSGYYHGAMEQVAIDKGFDYIVRNANSICEPIAAKGKYTFYHYNCVHGLGHGFMFVKDGDLFASLKACDSLTDNWERTSCYGGTFMQNIMNEQTPDSDIKTGSKFLRSDEPMYPCTAADDKYKDQCYLMQTSYALQVENYDFSKVFSLCDQTPQAYKDTCYTSLGRDASGNSVSNVDQTRQHCMLGTTFEAQKYCVHGAAMDFVSYFHSDVQAKQLCSSLSSNLSSDCLTVVKNYYSTF
jgi:hypothetical protein